MEAVKICGRDEPHCFIDLQLRFLQETPLSPLSGNPCVFSISKVIQARPLGWGPFRAPVLGDGLVYIYLITAVIRYIDIQARPLGRACMPSLAYNIRGHNK